MTIQEAIQRLVSVARENVCVIGGPTEETIEACEKLEEIFRLTLKRKDDINVQVKWKEGK